MTKFYAQIDANDIVFAVTQTHAEIIAADMIELPNFDAAKIGMTYDRGNDVFNLTPAAAIRVISTRAFYRRMTTSERQVLRGASGDVADLRDDLQRTNSVDLDGDIEQQLLAVGGVFSQVRITALLVDGTEAETEGM